MYKERREESKEGCRVERIEGGKWGIKKEQKAMMRGGKRIGGKGRGRKMRARRKSGRNYKGV